MRKAQNHLGLDEPGASLPQSGCHIRSKASMGLENDLNLKGEILDHCIPTSHTWQEASMPHINLCCWTLGDHLSSLQSRSSFSCPSLPGFPLLLWPEHHFSRFDNTFGRLTMCKLISYPPVGQHILLAFPWFVGVRAHLKISCLFRAHLTMFITSDGVMIMARCSNVPGNGWP